MKRRVNTKFLIILTVVIVGAGGGVVVLKKFWHDNPAKYVKAADDFMAQGNYEKAAQNYGTAFGAGNQKDLDLLMKQAEAWRKLAETEPPYIGRTLACWSKTLEINHDYVPALEKLLAFWDEQSKSASADNRNTVYTRVREYAERLSKADPSNKLAAAKVPMTVVQGWLYGVATEPKALDAATASLVKMMPQDPSNAEIPTVLAQGYLKASQVAAQRQDPAGAAKAIKEAGEIFDTALKGQDENVEMHARAAAVYSIVARASRDEADKKAYADKLKVEIDRVRALAKPTDERHVDELMTVATVMAQNGDVAGSEAVLAEVAKAQPDNQAARLAYAKAVATTPAGREEAIKILSAPVAQKGSAARIRQVEAQTLVELCTLQLERYGDLADPAEKTAALTQIEGNLAKLEKSAGESTGLLRLRGQVYLLSGRVTEAIQTLAKAKSMLEQQGVMDDQLLYVLAGAYVQARQTGDAKTLLTQILRHHPEFVSARRTMAQLFLAENDADNAEPHVAALEKALPDDPDVKRQRMAIYMMRKQPEEAKKLYGDLPEGDIRTKLGKAQVAMAIGNFDDAIRLLEDVRKAEPKNSTVIRLLVGAYRGRNDMASARRVVDEAIAANPADLMLVALRKQLAGATGEEMVQFTREIVEKNPDVYARELQLAAIAAEENKEAEALDHLKKAEQLKPEDKQVLEALFQAYARQAKWDLASQYVEKLAKINADRANGALYRFRLLMGQGKYAEALAAAQDLSVKMPEFAQTWVTLAQGQQATGHLDAAVSAYQRALEKQSDNADAMRGLIDCAYLQNKADDALRYINQARRTFPTNPYFKELELRHSLRFGDPAQAVAQWEEARKQSPEVRANWVNLSQAYWRAMTTAKSQNDAAGVKKYGDAIGALAVEGATKWPDERIFYAYQADLAASRGDMAGGVDALTRLAAQPTWQGKPEPALLLADYYLQFGKFAEAETAAQDALTKSAGGDDTAARQKLAQVQAMAGKVDDAIKTLDAKPDNLALAKQKLQLLMAAHRLDSAEKLATSLLEKDPKAADVLNAIVAIYIDGGQFDKAMAKVSEVLATDPDNVAALYGRGMVYLRRPKPDLDKAIADLRVVRDKEERDVQPRYWLAEAYIAKSDYDSALRELGAAVRAQPANKGLRLRLVQVCSTATPPRWVEAERALREGRALPGMAADADLAVAETRMWIARQQADRAVEVARQAVAANKGNGDVVRAYADALLASGNYQRLLDETEAFVAKPDTAPWWVFQSRGIAKRRLDKKDDAMAEFERALNSKEAQQNDEVAAAVLNTLASEIGVDEALSRVASKGGSNPRWQLMQAYLYQQKRDYGNAIATVEKLMADMNKLPADQRVTLLRFAGTLYLSAQPNPMPEKALEAFKRSLKEYPDDTAVLNNIASLLTDYLDPPKPQEALQYSQHAYDLMMKSGRVEPLVLDTHGRVLTMVNRAAEGIVLLQDAADRTSIPDVHYHLAEAYMQQKAPEEAQKHLVQAAAAIEKAKKADQPVDAKMAKRVDELMAEAKKMIESKAQAGAR